MKRSGFTRSEVVISAGAAVLCGALLWPAAAQTGFFGVFARARENARRASCQSNLKQIGLGLAQYTQDYDEKYPLARIGGESYGWANALQPYMRNTQIFQCPSEHHGPQSNPRKPGYTDYWFNRNLSGASLASINSPAQSFSQGDGDGGAAASDARYNLPSLPAKWRYTSGSPARRHLDGGNYAYADGHVKWLLPANVTAYPLQKLPMGAGTFKLK